VNLEAIAMQAESTNPVEEIGSLKTQFLASLNHEIRTPLTGILGMAELLMETPLNEEQKQYLSIVRVCAEDLLSIINTTLEYSQLATGQATVLPVEFHLPESIRSAVAPYTAKAWAKGIRLTCRLAPGLPDIAIGDATRIRQVLAHVIENAIKFSERGRIEVGAEGASENGGFRLVLKVRDTGMGIPPDKLKTIFDSFRQLDGGFARSHTGLGLGLSLAHALVQLMGGDLSVTSAVERGTTFSVVLPLDLPPARTATQSPVMGTRGGSHRRRILMVEDDTVAQKIVTHVLGRHAHEVECASSGPEALRMASSGPYDLILMDIQMPGMGGLETAARIRAIEGYASVPVVALTADSSDENRRLCFEGGMRGFVSKPIQADELLHAISFALS
jgi:CheY-like chemotaxis protein